MKKMTVKRESLTEQITSILEERIVEGTLLPGDRLKELQIAKEFGTSQAPVREAIRSLQAMGYVEHKPHVGALVKSFTKKEIEEAYQIREALEGHSIMLADLENSQLIATLKVHLAQMKSALKVGDVKMFTQADNQFHRTIIEASQNIRMLEMWDSLKIQLQVIATLAETAIPLEEIYELHPPIVEALEKKQKDDFSKFLARHYRETGNHWKLHG